MCPSGSWTTRKGRAMEGQATVEKAEGAVVGLAETIVAAVTTAMVVMTITMVAVATVAAATQVVEVAEVAIQVVEVAAVATLVAVGAALVVEVEAGETTTYQVLLLRGTTQPTPWAPRISAPLAGTSRRECILSAHTV